VSGNPFQCLYCLNGRTSELVAAPVQAAELAALAARLPSARTVCGWPATGAWPAARGAGRDELTRALWADVQSTPLPGRL